MFANKLPRMGRRPWGATTGHEDDHLEISETRKFLMCASNQRLSGFVRRVWVQTIKDRRSSKSIIAASKVVPIIADRRNQRDING